MIKGAADILELFERIKKENEKTADSEQSTDDITEEQAEADVVKLFVFDNLMMCAGFRMCLTAFTAAEMIYTATLQAISTILWPTRVSILRRNSTRCAISFQSTHIRRTMCLPMKHFSRSMVM